LRLHISEEEETRFGHYTNKHAAEALLFDESPFRLNTVATANDPEEGLSLLQILDFTNINTDTQYQAFVGCFTFNYDCLNQFRLYGKLNNAEATGVSIVVNNDLFEADPIINRGLIVNKEIKYIAKSKFKESLFRCVYIDPQTSRVISIGHKEPCVFYRESYMYENVDETVRIYKEKIKKKEENVIKEFINLYQLINALHEDIRKNNSTERDVFFLTNLPVLLIHLRYLIKNYAFKEEQECRVIKVENLFNNENVIVDDSKSKMHIEYFPICQRRENINHVTDIFWAPKAEGFEIFRDRIKHSGLSILTRKSKHPFS
jgi:hypothetical protein